jgi:hypothetical protein
MAEKRFEDQYGDVVARVARRQQLITAAQEAAAQRRAEAEKAAKRAREDAERARQERESQLTPLQQRWRAERMRAAKMGKDASGLLVAAEVTPDFTVRRKIGGALHVVEGSLRQSVAGRLVSGRLHAAGWRLSEQNSVVNVGLRPEEQSTDIQSIPGYTSPPLNETTRDYIDASSGLSEVVARQYGGSVVRGPYRMYQTHPINPAQGTWFYQSGITDARKHQDDIAALLIRNNIV